MFLYQCFLGKYHLPTMRENCFVRLRLSQPSQAPKIQLSSAWQLTHLPHVTFTSQARHQHRDGVAIQMGSNIIRKLKSQLSLVLLALDEDSPEALTSILPNLAREASEGE